MASAGGRKGAKSFVGSKLQAVESTKERKKNRGIAKDQELIERVILEKFPPYDDPPYRSDGEVARRLGLTVQAVWPLVVAGLKQGIVSPLYYREHEKREVARLESAVQKRFQLQRVILVPGLDCVLGDLDPNQRRNVQKHVVHAMAPRVAEHLDALLAAAARKQKSFTLGVAWGGTMLKIAEHLQNRQNRIRADGLEVVPIVGITCESTREPIEANVIAMRFAVAYQGKSSQLACPAFVPQIDAWAVQRLVQARRMLKKLPSCDAVITSMGPIPDDEHGADQIAVSADRALNNELFKSARTWKAVGEICGWLFDENGSEVTTNLAAIGLGFDGLRKIAADPQRQVILVAGGDSRRFVPLRAALRARLASVLVSDTITAKFLVGEK